MISRYNQKGFLQKADYRRSFLKLLPLFSLESFLGLKNISVEDPAGNSLHGLKIDFRGFLAFGPRKVSESLEAIASEDPSESGRDFHNAQERRTDKELSDEKGKPRPGKRSMQRCYFLTYG